MRLLTRRRVLVGEKGSTYLADDDNDSNEPRALQRVPGRTTSRLPGAMTVSPCACARSGLVACERACLYAVDACGNTGAGFPLEFVPSCT